jgi:hypothetical protein
MGIGAQIAACLVILALGAIGWRLAGRATTAEPDPTPLDLFADLVRRRVIVHTRDGQSIRGVLVGEYRDCLVLEAAEFLREAPGPEDIAGRAVVERNNVSWLQVLEP